MNADSASGGPWSLHGLQVTSGTECKAHAEVHLAYDGGTIVDKAAAADGPAQAVFMALDQATGIFPVLENFELHSVTSGEDAQGEATVTVEFEGETWRGHGASTDIVEAGARAYLEVINRILRRRQRELADAPGATGQRVSV
jgi:2-isopropylmalate synthase